MAEARAGGAVEEEDGKPVRITVFGPGQPFHPGTRTPLAAPVNRHRPETSALGEGGHRRA
jgi:hypothetical protein